MPHAPDRVWRALTDRDALTRWFLPASGDIATAVGHRFSFAGEGASGIRVDCTVTEALPNRHLVYTWQSDGQSSPSRVEWTLEPIEGGTLLHLRHDAPKFPTDGLARLSACLGVHSPRRSALPRRRALHRTVAPHRTLYLRERTLQCR